VTASTSIFPPLPPLPPLPLDSGPSFIDQLDNSSQLSDIENEIIAQTLLSANVKQKKSVDSQPKDSLPPLFRARLLDSPAQSLEGEVIYGGGGSIEGLIFPCTIPLTATIPQDLPSSSFTSEFIRTKAPNIFREESIDLIELRQSIDEPKMAAVADPQPLIIIDTELKKPKIPPVVVDDKLLAAIHRDPSVSKSHNKRSTKSRRKHHQFSRTNVVAPMEFYPDPPQQQTEGIYHIEEHIPRPPSPQLDLVPRGAEAPLSERVTLSDETATLQHRSYLARSTTIAEGGDHHQRIQKLRSSRSTPGDRLIQVSDNESLASSSSGSGVDESLYTATRVMPRSEPQRMSSTTSSTSTSSGSSAQALAPFAMPTKEEEPSPFVAADPVVVFHISGSNSNDGTTPPGRLPSSPMLSTKLMKSTNNQRPKDRHTSKMASMTTVSKVKRYNVMTASKGNRNRSPMRRESSEHGLSSTSSRIDQAKADHFRSPASPAVMNLGNLLGGGDTEPPGPDDIIGDI
jgi:hypothetical protein